MTPDIPLATAFAKTKKLDIEHLPVVVSEESNELVGVLNCRAVRRSLSAEVLARQKRADEASL
ncbi:MAG: CBS domain-containing protein [Planctomycetota bacterium]